MPTSANLRPPEVQTRHSHTGPSRHSSGQLVLGWGGVQTRPQAGSRADQQASPAGSAGVARGQKPPSPRPRQSRSLPPESPELPEPLKAEAAARPERATGGGAARERPFSAGAEAPPRPAGRPAQIPAPSSGRREAPALRLSPLSPPAGNKSPTAPQQPGSRPAGEEAPPPAARGGGGAGSPPPLPGTPPGSPGQAGGRRAGPLPASQEAERGAGAGFPRDPARPRDRSGSAGEAPLPAEASPPGKTSQPRRGRRGGRGVGVLFGAGGSSEPPDLQSGSRNAGKRGGGESQRAVGGPRPCASPVGGAGGERRGQVRAAQEPPRCKRAARPGKERDGSGQETQFRELPHPPQQPREHLRHGRRGPKGRLQELPGAPAMESGALAKRA
ncbi:basic salivary proline-rich protein 1-like [Ahaetulla prasina]|uniref:basic salivary proline-rich protein 1-like n=1 Tax=Ahaetulla prasina TaxID=499056 RepID=UPI002649E18A|nr:basic salivary proline-rich protein 1-like [Ahaetulla prasina]